MHLVFEDLNDEYLLIEKNDELVLLSIDDLLRESFKQQQTKKLSDPEKLLFPEIIYCAENTDTKLALECLNQFGIKANIIESRITIEKVPHWMIKEPVKLICHELIRGFDKNEFDTEFESEQKSAEHERANYILQLLNRLEDISVLQMQRLSKARFLELLL